MTTQTTTLDQKNAKVLQIRSHLEAKLGKTVDVVLKALEKVDPDRFLTFEQAHRIEYLEAHNVALGFILSRVEEAQQMALREFNRLRGNGVDVDEGVIQAVKGCLVEKRGDSHG